MKDFFLPAAEITGISEAAVSYKTLVAGVALAETGVSGWIAPLVGVKINPGVNAITITDCPTNMASVSVWMTEGGGNGVSIARGAVISTQSVQIENQLPNGIPVIRVYCTSNYRTPVDASAQIFLFLT